MYLVIIVYCVCAHIPLGQLVSDAGTAASQDDLVAQALCLEQLDQLGQVLDVDVLLGHCLRDYKSIGMQFHRFGDKVLVRYLTAKIIGIYHIVALQAIMSGIGVKQQNDREKWYMVDSSFMTTLPDIWGIKQKFILLPINKWDKEYERVFLGGLTCDSQDYYNAEEHANAIFLPKVTPDDPEPLYIGFFHTGAYQESIAGYGGIQHCLQPAPKHIIIDKTPDGDYTTKLFSKEQTYKSMLKILGY